MNTETFTTGCGDWGDSWGMSTNTIGKLRTSDFITFEWKGWSQGRHGQKWNRGAYFVFTLNEDGFAVEIEKLHTRPNAKAITTAIAELRNIRIESIKKAERKVIREAKREAKLKAKENQLTLKI